MTRVGLDTGSSDARRRLEHERDFLLRSIEDLDAERDAGDVSPEDYAAMHADYTARAAAVLRALEEPVTGTAPEDVAPADVAPTGEPPADESRPSRRRRRWLLWAAVGLFAVAAVVLVAAEVTSRLPGETSSGSVSLSAAEQLQRTLGQAQVLESEGKDAEALTLYHQVLQQDPTQEQALAESGWLEFEAGVSARNTKALSTGQATEEQAEQVDSQAYAPHLYLGAMLLTEGNDAQAASEFSRFLASDPPLSSEQTAWPYVVKAFTGAREPVPAAPAGVGG